MNIINIPDYEDPRLDPFTRMNERQLLHMKEPFWGAFLTESPKVTDRALEAGLEPLSVLVSHDQLSEEARHTLSMCGDVPVFTGTCKEVRELTGIPMTRGLLCCFRRPDLVTVEKLLEDKHRIAVMENVTNPTNVGAIFRSAAALGMEAVLLNHACSDPYYRRASRVAMGTVFQVPWTYLECRETEEPIHFTRLLQRQGFKLAAMALKEDTVGIDHPDLRKEEKLAVILGAEGDGLTEETIQACDYTVKIPMSNNVDSLNVAAASAVAFWELGRRG